MTDAEQLPSRQLHAGHARAEEGEDADPAGRQRLHERERRERDGADVAEEPSRLGCKAGRPIRGA